MFEALEQFRGEISRFERPVPPEDVAGRGPFAWPSDDPCVRRRSDGGEIVVTFLEQPQKIKQRFARHHSSRRYRSKHRSPQVKRISAPSAIARARRGSSAIAGAIASAFHARLCLISRLAWRSK